MAEVARTSQPAVRPVQGAPPARRRGVLDSFADPQFRWFYLSMLGQMASMNMQMVVRGYLAFVLTGSYAAIGVIALASAVPMLVLSPFGGVAADRLPKRAVLQIGQLLSALNAAALAVLAFTGLISIEWLAVSGLLQGTVMAMTMPSRQSMIPEIVGIDRMMNAVSLNMAGMNGMRLFAPAAGGFIVALAGFGWAFLTMSALYASAVFSLSRVHWRPATLASEAGHGLMRHGRTSLSDIRDAVRYIAGDPVMSTILGLSFVSSIFAFPYLFLLPGYVADVLGGGASEIGLLISISAIGSLGGAAVVASLPDRGRGVMLLGGMALLGMGLFGFAQTVNFAAAAVALALVGGGSALYGALTQGLLHGYVDNAYRGRVMSVFMMQFTVMQVGTFLVGGIAEVVGIRVAFAGLGAALVLLTAAAFVLVPRIRRLD